MATPDNDAGVFRRLLAGRSDERRTRSDRIRAIAQTYIQNSRDDIVAKAIDDLIDAKIRHFEAVADGPHRNVGRLSEGGVLAVLGASGAGKTRLLEREFHRRVEFKGYGTPDCLLVSVKARSPFSFSGFALDLAAAAGVSVDMSFRNRDAAFRFARKQLVNRIAFVHIDEIQLFLASSNPDDLAAGQNLLRSLCQDPEWPVSLVISGLPSAARLFADNQVSRRQNIRVLGNVDLEQDGATLVRGLRDFLDKAQLELDLDLSELLPRLAHGCLDQLGDCFAVIAMALDNALRLGATHLGMEHFALAFHERTSCSADLNVFNEDVADFQSVDVVALYEQKRGADALLTKTKPALAAPIAGAPPPADIDMHRLRIARSK